MGRLFGTDGVRGVANRDLTPELAFELGLAAARVLVRGRSGRIVIGRDTRVSGEMLEAALVAGLTSAGVNAELLGIVPTPAVAFYTRHKKADAGAMISASHNPVEDNGIKFFTAEGYKLFDETEEEIERFIDDGSVRKIPRPTGLAVGRVYSSKTVEEEYVDYLGSTVNTRLDGLKVVVDCAFGATFKAAPRLLRSLGADVVPLHAEDDGSRINVKCGSTHPEELRRQVLLNGAQVGLAHDGDGDRVLAVDENGELVDGDEIMAICGLQFLEEGKLPKRAIAATVYSNLGLIEAFRKAGGDVLITDNGDRRVLDAMLKKGLALGGEQSGHIIFLEHNTTGDGLLTAVQLLSVMVRTGQPLSFLAKRMRKFPQILENVRVAKKNAWKENPAVRRIIAECQAELGATGRIFVRASGTEPLIRIMAEGPEVEVLTDVVHRIAGVIKEEFSG